MSVTYEYTRELFEGVYDINLLYVGNELLSQLEMHCQMIEEGALLSMIFAEALSTDDKTTLDSIVEASRNFKYPATSRVTILSDIFKAADQEQQARLLDALDKYSSYLVALDIEDWAMGRTRIQLALTNEDITQDDYNLIDSKMPADEE